MVRSKIGGKTQHARATFLVRPRYTTLSVVATKAGAKSIAKAERAQYESDLLGERGLSFQTKAHRLGLDGIVMMRTGENFTDLLTGKFWIQPDRVYLPNGQPVVMGSSLSWKGEVYEVMSMRSNGIVFCELPGCVVLLKQLRDATVV
jgi:hypothetical protein